MFKPYRCLLCGETYLGERSTDRCPYCGADGRLQVPAAEWPDDPAPKLDDVTVDICREGLAHELSNAAFYRDCRKKAETSYNAAVFERLSKQESEHAEIFSRLLGQPVPALPLETAPAADSDKFAAAHLREETVIKFYLYAAVKATNFQVKAVLRYLSDIENEHLQMSNVYR